MSKELLSLCQGIPSSNRLRLSALQRWLEMHKDKCDLLKEAATYKDDKRNTPLHYLVAAIDPTLDLVERIMQHAPEAAKEKNISGQLPLHLACKSRSRNSYDVIKKASYDIIKKLLEAYPAAIKVKDNEGELPLHSAFSATPNVIMMLFEAYPQAARVKNNKGELPLHVACYNNVSYDIIKMIFNKYKLAAKVKNKSGCLPIHIACQYASDDVIKMLLQAFPKSVEMKDNYGSLPLHHACHGISSLEVMKILLKAYPKALEVENNSGDFPLHIACLYKASPIIKLILEAYPEAAKSKNDERSILFRGMLPLHLALYKKASANVIKSLVKAYPKAVEIRDEEGHLPLHLAARWKPYTCVIKMLVEAYPEGAKVPDIEGDLPIHIAIQNFYSHNNTSEVMELLLSAYPKSLDIRGRWSKLPSDNLREFKCQDYLIFDAIADRYSIHFLKLVLHAYPPENCLKIDNNGMVPLHHACLSTAPHFPDYVMKLLEANTDCLAIKDNQGRTPLQLLTKAASTHLESKVLPLHQLAAGLTTISQESLHLLVDAFPESITLPDQNGMLPFHHACLNQASSLELLMLLLSLSPEAILPCQILPKPKVSYEKACKRRRL